jgi:hypothetical protein
MGCKNGRLGEEETRRNSKLKEEFDDIDVENYDDEFDFENASHTSKASYLELISFKFTILVASLTLRIFL